jgi:uncharacterized protein YoxC
MLSPELSADMVAVMSIMLLASVALVGLAVYLYSDWNSLDARIDEVTGAIGELSSELRAFSLAIKSLPSAASIAADSISRAAVVTHRQVHH